MINIPKIDIQPYVDMAWRRKWWIITPLVLSLFGGLVFVLISPKVYRASTLILVESQRVPSSYVQSTISESLNSRLRTITQQVNSRTNLESIIDEYDLFESQAESGQGWLDRGKKWFKETVGIQGSMASQDESQHEPSMLSQVNQVRKKINVQLRGGDRAFEISFEWNQPHLAAEVANAIASQFIEQNLRVREEMAMGTTNFLASEVERIRRDLVQKEQALEEFKRKNMGRLPSQLQSNLNVLNQLKEERNNLEKRMDMETQQAILIKNQLVAIKNQELPIDVPEGDAQGKGVSLAKLQQDLEHLRTRYTEEHPDVLALKRRIAKFQQVKKEEMRKEGDENHKEDSFSPVSQRLSQQKGLQWQLNQIQARVAEYEKQIQDLTAEIQDYRERVEATSKVELELKDLQRDYEAVNERYQGLLSKKFSAQMSEEMEKRQKGEQFRVVDSAVAPDRPFKPDVQKIMFMALFLGLGLGGGLAYVWESLDPSFYNPEEVEGYLDTDVVVSLPIEELQKKRKRFLGRH